MNMNKTMLSQLRGLQEERLRQSKKMADQTKDELKSMTKAFDLENMTMDQLRDLYQKRFTQKKEKPFGGLVPKYAHGGQLEIETSFFEGLVPGAGGGMDDVVPANIEGMEPVLLSRDEYVIPADVVSHIGDGSTTRGGELLDQMIDNIRKEKTATTVQPDEIDQTPEQIVMDMRRPERYV
tara:strand:- start:351 stop:890 length:540 start_codon:yes stop_codon:yes gene_type:complete